MFLVTYKLCLRHNRIGSPGSLRIHEGHKRVKIVEQGMIIKNLDPVTFIATKMHP